jgi:hypothetical protein
MQAHRIETIVQPGGSLALRGLPLRAGARVEVIVLVKEEAGAAACPPHGGTHRYEDPFDLALPRSERECDAES